MQKTKDLSIVTMNEGGIVEQVDMHLRKIAADILDPNTDAEAPRTVNVTITVKPNKNRQAGTSITKVYSKLAPSQQEAGLLFFGFDEEGNAVVTEELNTQQQLPFDGADNAEHNDKPGIVTPIKGNEK